MSKRLILILLLVFACGSFLLLTSFTINSQFNQPGAQLGPTDEVRLNFTRVLIEPATIPNGHKAKGIGDFNGDGFADVFAVYDSQGTYVYTYPNWTKYRISTYGGADTEDAQVVDLDGDGDLDIVMGGLGAKIIWLENPLKQGENPLTTAWTLHDIASGVPSHDLLLADLNKDGTLDVVANGAVFLQLNPDFWVTIPNQYIVRNPGIEGTTIADIDGNGYPDIVLVDRNPDDSTQYLVYWLENPLPAKDLATNNWTKRVIAEGWNETTIVAADVNKDNRLDIVIAPMYGTGGLFWLQAPTDPRTGTWTRNLIDDSVQFVHQDSIKVADMDKDGKLDLALIEQEQSTTRRLIIFFSAPSLTGVSWTRQIVANTGGHNMKLGDIGKDGNLDLLNANHGYFGAPNPVELWRSAPNTQPTARPTFTVAPTPTLAPATEYTVVEPSDDGTGGTSGTLSFALRKAGAGERIRFKVPGQIITIQGNSLPPLKNGATLYADLCESPIVIRATSGQKFKLTLEGKGTIHAVRFEGIKLLFQTNQHVLRCTAVK